MEAPSSPSPSPTPSEVTSSPSPNPSQEKTSVGTPYSPSPSALGEKRKKKRRAEGMSNRQEALGKRPFFLEEGSLEASLISPSWTGCRYRIQLIFLKLPG